MTETEKRIVEKLRAVSAKFAEEAAFLLPAEEFEEGTVIPINAFHCLEEEGGELIESYEGPEIDSYLEFTDGSEIGTYASCIVAFEPEEMKIVEELSERLRAELGESFDVEDLSDGVLLGTGFSTTGKGDDWEERFLAGLDDEEFLEMITQSFLFGPCSRLVEYSVLIDLVLAGDLSIDEVIDLERDVEEAEE